MTHHGLSVSWKLASSWKSGILSARTPFIPFTQPLNGVPRDKFSALAVLSQICGEVSAHMPSQIRLTYVGTLIATGSFTLVRLACINPVVDVKSFKMFSWFAIRHLLDLPSCICWTPIISLFTWYPPAISWCRAVLVAKKSAPQQTWKIMTSLGNHRLGSSFHIIFPVDFPSTLCLPWLIFEGNKTRNRNSAQLFSAHLSGSSSTRFWSLGPRKLTYAGQGSRRTTGVAAIQTFLVVSAWSGTGQRSPLWVAKT